MPCRILQRILQLLVGRQVGVLVGIQGKPVPDLEPQFPVGAERRIILHPSQDLARQAEPAGGVQHLLELEHAHRRRLRAANDVPGFLFRFLEGDGHNPLR